MIHTMIWIFFNIVIFYMLYAVLLGELDIWFWIGYGCVITEGLILLIFKMTCPLSLVARKYTSNEKDNFDIYLPPWLARNTKRIYSGLTLIITVATLIRITN